MTRNFLYVYFRLRSNVYFTVFGLVVAAMHRPLVLTMLVFSYLLYADSGRYAGGLYTTLFYHRIW